MSDKEKRIDLQIYVYADALFLGHFDSKILSDKTIQAIKKDVEKHFADDTEESNVVSVKDLQTFKRMRYRD
jgi:serine/threonine protein phosphatase PrpC